MIAQIQAAGKQQTSLEKVSGQQEGASVSLSKESPITNTWCAFLVALVLMLADGFISFARLAFPESHQLFHVLFLLQP